MPATVLAEHDWAALARPGQTLAVYMGVGAAQHVERRLLAAGIDPETPVTVVENGTLPTQKVALGTIAGLAELLIDAGIKGPAMIFVGAHPVERAAVASLAEAATRVPPRKSSSRRSRHDAAGPHRQPAPRRCRRVPGCHRLGGEPGPGDGRDVVRGGQGARRAGPAGHGGERGGRRLPDRRRARGRAAAAGHVARAAADAGAVGAARSGPAGRTAGGSHVSL